MSPLVIAHRGASHAYAEHTRAAYLQALADGADGVECDVQLTRDRQLVCWHDPSVDRTSDGHGQLVDHTLAELRRLDVHSWHGKDLPADRGTAAEQLLSFPDLVELLLEADRPVKLAVEFKHPSPFGHELEERTLSWLLRRGWDPESGLLGRIRISFMSFFPGSLEFMAPIAGVDPLCQLLDLIPADVPSRFARGPLSRAAVRATLRASTAEGERLIWSGRSQLAGPSVEYVRTHLADVKAWMASGRRLRVWTADAARDVAFLAANGIQEITTNRPADVLAWLRDPAAALADSR